MIVLHLIATHLANLTCKMVGVVYPHDPTTKIVCCKLWVTVSTVLLRVSVLQLMMILPAILEMNENKKLVYKEILLVWLSCLQAGCWHLSVVGQELVW